MLVAPADVESISQIVGVLPSYEDAYQFSWKWENYSGEINLTLGKQVDRVKVWVRNRLSAMSVRITFKFTGVRVSVSEKKIEFTDTKHRLTVTDLSVLLEPLGQTFVDSLE
ncbi:MAG TPA: hypothetical protein VF303_00035 [Candidatus Nanoarchaeia archaeon]